MRGLWGMHFLNATTTPQVPAAEDDEFQPLDMSAWHAWAQAAEPEIRSAAPAGTGPLPSPRPRSGHVAPAGSPSAG